MIYQKPETEVLPMISATSILDASDGNSPAETESINEVKTFDEGEIPDNFNSSSSLWDD